MTYDPGGKTGMEGERRFAKVNGEIKGGFADLRKRSTLMTGDGLDGWFETVEAAQALALLRQTMLEEVRRHEEHDRSNPGGSPAREFDLEDIRARIGRRLDRIRNARGAG